MAKINRGTNNVQFVTELMERASAGPLMQAFVLQALISYSTRCIEAGAQAFDNDLLHGQSWVDCAKEVKDELETRVGRELD